MTVNKKHEVSILAILTVASLGLVACKKETQESVASVNKKIDPLALESQLNILGLKGQVESGKNNPAYDWVTPFEAASGCRVESTLVEDNVALTEQLLKKEFDLVITAETLLPVVELQPIDLTRLRSIGKLDERFASDSSIKSIQALPFQWHLLPPTVPATEFITHVEYTHLLAKAPHPNCAYAWMEWTLSPKVQGDIASALGTIPVVPTACVGNELLGDEACKQRMNVAEAVAETHAAESTSD